MISTNRLMHIIVNAKTTGDLQNPEFQNSPTFTEYLMGLMDDRGVTPAALGRAMLLERTHAYQLFNGIRVPTRKHILLIAFILKLNVDETQRMLKIAGRAELYPRKHYDAVILYALNNGMSLDNANELLAQSGEIPLIE